jgi:uncharacterized membrane protein YkvA (DUF1232 family)
VSLTTLAIAFGACLLVYLAFLGVLLLAGRRREAIAYARVVPDAIGLFGRLARDPDVPRAAKLLVLVAIAYLALPFDLVPDFIPVVGALDDVLVVVLVLRVVLAAAGPELVRRHWRGPPETLRLVLRANPGRQAPARVE